MLKITNLSHCYGSKWVLKDVNLSIDRPQICALLGRNGAGKSTTLKCIAGLLTPTKGQIWICSNPVLSSISVRFHSQYKNDLGYLPETSPLYPEMTVWDYLKWIGRLRKIKRPLLEHRINEISQMCGLSSFLHKQIGLLSKGMKQRVCLAQALIHSPSVLLLDEIYSGLDPHQADEIQNLLIQLKTSTSILLSTHQLNRAQEVADQVVILENGEVCGSGSMHSLSTSLGQHYYTLIVDSPLQVDQLPHSLQKCFNLNHSCTDTPKKAPYTYAFEGTLDEVDLFLQWLNHHANLKLRELRKEKPSLSEVYRYWTADSAR